MEVKMGSESGRLSLMIDPGDGVWRYSNSTRGVVCSATLGLSCGGAVKGGFGMRSFQAALRTNGTARFALAVTPSEDAPAEEPIAVTIAGIAIAPVGVRWNSL